VCHSKRVHYGENQMKSKVFRFALTITLEGEDERRRMVNKKFSRPKWGGCENEKGKSWFQASAFRGISQKTEALVWTGSSKSWGEKRVIKGKSAWC